MPSSIQDIVPDEDWYEIRAGAELKALSHPVARQHPDSTKWTTLNFTRWQAYLVEGIDDFFQHDSALMMPDTLPLWASGRSEDDAGKLGEGDSR